MSAAPEEKAIAAGPTRTSARLTSSVPTSRCATVQEDQEEEQERKEGQQAKKRRKTYTAAAEITAHGGPLYRPNEVTDYLAVYGHYTEATEEAQAREARGVDFCHVAHEYGEGLAEADKERLRGASVDAEGPKEPSSDQEDGLWYDMLFAVVAKALLTTAATVC